MKLFITLFLGLTLINLTYSQTGLNTRSTFQYSIEKTDIPVLIDAKEDDPAWQAVSKIPNLMNHWPIDTGAADALTEIKLTYDDNFIYIIGVLHDKGGRVIQSLRRDNSEAHWNSDNFTVVLDPMGNKQNGFLFGVNAGGAQMEGQLNVMGAQTETDENWDNKWYSHVEQYMDHWIVEMAIPFKTLRYNSNISEWGINFIRGDMSQNSYSTWTQFPLNYGGNDLNFMGTLKWTEKPKKATGKVVLIPYIAGGTTRDFEDETQTAYKQDFDTGIDAKLAVTGSLSLDLTFNPDFSNVDVDQQVTNLTRFSIFLPERRNFFLENGDIFSNFGGWEIKPFFSRTIGLNQGQQVPITYGARLTGNVTNKTRIGLMNIQTKEFNELQSQNYTVGALHHQVLKRSVIKGILINRNTGADITEGKYARNGGLEFAYLSPSGKISNTIRLHAATTDQKLNDNYYYGFNGRYNGRSYRAGWTLDVVGQNYITELGFNPRQTNFNALTEEVTRQGYTRINPWSLYRFYPKTGKLNMHGPRTWHNTWFDKNGRGLIERSHGFAYDFQFKNTTELKFQAQIREVNLPVPTALIGNDFSPLPSENYLFTSYWITYNTDRRKTVNADFRLQYGNFFNGTRLNSSVNLNYRVQPWGSFGINYDYNKIEFPGEFGETTLHLIRANMEISFSNKMFWTTAIQYNSQSENYNIFSRFQWRFKPMSDFFLVYTDNYTTDGLNIKNRQIVFKLSYWLNM